VRVNATVIGETAEDEPILAKKIDIGFIGDAKGPEVDFFTNVLQQDRSITGAFTAFPRRG
jgi:hypothetical protein